MYIPPGFTVITCEPVREEAFRAWAVENGGVWQPEERLIAWEFPPGCGILAYLGTPDEKETAQWTPRMHTPPQSVIGVVIEEGAGSDEEQWTPLIRALFARWDSYAYDAGPEYISVLLRAILPAERIIRYEPPLSAGPAWIWVNGRYTRNEAYDDAHDAAAAAPKNQL